MADRQFTGMEGTDSPRTADGGLASEMKLRDYFAGQVVSGMFAGGSHRGVYKEIADSKHGFTLTPTEIGHETERQIAFMAYTMADAMLAERDKAR